MAKIQYEYSARFHAHNYCTRVLLSAFCLLAHICWEALHGVGALLIKHTECNSVLGAFHC